MIPNELNKRKQKALDDIKSAYGTPEQEYGVTMFGQHHIAELGPEYWQKHLGLSKPDPKNVLDLLVLQGTWDEDCVFDFTLPDEVTTYVISVRFDTDGRIEEISMES